MSMIRINGEQGANLNTGSRLSASEPANLNPSRTAPPILSAPLRARLSSAELSQVMKRTKIQRAEAEQETAAGQAESETLRGVQGVIICVPPIGTVIGNVIGSAPDDSNRPERIEIRLRPASSWHDND
jgi:hypothetical protein